MSLIELAGVSKSYGKKAAITNMSCSLRGRAIGLVGPNGAGKTTFMKLCLGLLSADAGQIKVMGQVITPRTAFRGRFGFAAEGTGHLPHLSGLECVAYAGQLCGLKRRTAYLRAHDMLDLVGLDEARYRPAETYSTGMLQRTKVAMALAHDPDLLFLDEPTSGLDPSSRAEFLDLLLHLKATNGPAIVLSTHILHDVERACDEVLILTDGQIRYSGPLADLQSDESQNYAVRLLAQSTSFVNEARQRGIEVTQARQGIYRLTLPVDFSPQAIWSAAEAAQAVIIGLEQEKEGFEAAFLDQVSGERP